LSRAFQLLADLEQELKTSSQPRYLFEAALIRLATLGAVRPIEEVLADLAGGRPVSRTAEPAPPVPAARPRAAEPARPLPATPSEKKKTAAGDLGAALIAAVRSSRPLLAAILEQAVGIVPIEGAVRIRLRADMDALRRQLELRDGLDVLRREASALSGEPVRVEIEMLRDEGEEEADGEEMPAAPEPALETPVRRTVAERPVRRPARAGADIEREARREPGVAKLLDAFAAQVLEASKLDVPADAANDTSESPLEEP
jgi:hypothetical protein